MLFSDKQNELKKNTLISGVIYILIAIILSTLIEFNVIKTKN